MGTIRSRLEGLEKKAAPAESRAARLSREQREHVARHRAWEERYHAWDAAAMAFVEGGGPHPGPMPQQGPRHPLAPPERPGGDWVCVCVMARLRGVLGPQEYPPDLLPEEAAPSRVRADQLYQVVLSMADDPDRPEE